MSLLKLLRKKPDRAGRDMRMEVLLCFLESTFTIGDVLHMIEDSKEFHPHFVAKYGNWDDRKELTNAIYEELRNADSEANELLLSEGISFHDMENNYRLFFHTIPNSEKSQAIYLTLSNMRFLESEVFNHLVTHDRFISGNCYNWDDDFIQNSTFLEFYKLRKITPIATRKNYIGQIEVDIDKNPGKKEMLSRTWVASSWKMWFGKIFYSIVSKEKLQGFEKAFIIKELSNEVTFIQLYENPEEFDSKKNRQIQMSFKEWLNYEKLLEQFPRLKLRSG